MEAPDHSVSGSNGAMLGVCVTTPAYQSYNQQTIVTYDVKVTPQPVCGYVDQTAKVVPLSTEEDD